MDLPRFVSILSRGGLWFAKATTLRDDPWEGFGRAECLTAPPAGEWQEAADGRKTRTVSVRQAMAHFSQNSAEFVEHASEHLYVNSWCAGPESMAMWQIYGALGSGVALKSSVERYVRAAKFNVDDSHYDFAEVTYHTSLETVPDLRLDFRGSIPMPGPSLRREILKLGCHKRECFRHEHEWRALLYQDARPEVAGIDVDFDLGELISEVFVGPRAEAFIVDAVESIMEKFQLRKPCKRSDLLSSPRKDVAPAG